MTRRPLLLGILLGLFVLALGAAVWKVVQPEVLKVAVGPATGDDAKLLAASNHILRRHGDAVRLQVVPVDDPGEAAARLDKGEVDLAVVRSDQALPANGQTVAILHRNAAILLALPGSAIEDVSDLEGKTVGVLRGSTVNERLLETVLRHYEVPLTSVTRLLLGPADVLDAAKAKRMDALLVVAPVPSPLVAEALSAVASAGRGPAAFVPIGDAEAIALSDPAFEKLDIVRGSFGGSPPRPAEEITTLAVTYRLMAHEQLSDMVVTTLTRHLFEMRADLAQAVPQANRIEAPETNKGGKLPVHPGAAAYIDNEEQSFMDRYGDWFYIVAMVVGFFGSAAAALTSRLRSKRQDQAERLERLLRIMRDTRAAEDGPALERLEQEADDCFAETLQGASQQEIDTARLAAFSLALDQVRLAIADRRRLLAEREPGTVPAAAPTPLVRAVSDRG
jgi:TRAP transporter TAXI family solute receptor